MRSQWNRHWITFAKVCWENQQVGGMFQLLLLISYCQNIYNQNVQFIVFSRNFRLVRSNRRLEKFMISGKILRSLTRVLHLNLLSDKDYELRITYDRSKRIVIPRASSSCRLKRVSLAAQRESRLHFHFRFRCTFQEAEEGLQNMYSNKASIFMSWCIFDMD